MMKKYGLFILTAALLLTACGEVEIGTKTANPKVTSSAAATAARNTYSTVQSSVTAAASETAETTSPTKKTKKTKKTKSTAAETSESRAEAPTAVYETAAAQQQGSAEVTVTTTTEVQTQKPAETTVPALPAETPVTEIQYTAQPALEISEDPVADEPVRAKQIAVNYISQYPELPTGCETTSLTMLLNFYGVYADKVYIARNYLPKQAFYWQDGVMYGADYHTVFAGDPEDANSYGCYAPCIVTAANSYLEACGSGYSAQNISGQELDTLLTNYIDNDIPVLIWITSCNLSEPSWTTVWTTPAGGQVQWYNNEHCVVLTGYDYNSGLIYVSDPMAGNTYYDMELLKLRYEQFGRQCVCLTQ